MCMDRDERSTIVFAAALLVMLRLKFAVAGSIRGTVMKYQSNGVVVAIGSDARILCNDGAK